MLGIASAILGGVQLVGGIAAAASLGDRPSYTEDPNFARSAGRAETMAQMGYTPQERASFQGDLASAQATDYQRGMDVSGGNMAQALLGMNTSRATGALNRFAAQDAALRRQNIQYADSFSRERQARRDAQTRLDTQYRMAEEQAIGSAIQSGLTGIAGAFNFNQAMGSYLDKIGTDGNTGTGGTGGGGSEAVDNVIGTGSGDSVTGGTGTANQGYNLGAGQVGMGGTGTAPQGFDATQFMNFMQMIQGGIAGIPMSSSLFQGK